MRGYFEKMDTECISNGTSSPSLDKVALKVDGNGSSFKQSIGCNKLKSCDYFKAKSDTFYFIEFSDLPAQFNNVSVRFKELKESRVLTSKELKSFQADKVILKELREKYFHSLLIFHQMSKVYLINDSRRKSFCIGICLENQSDGIFFQAFKSRVEDSLRGLVDEVKIVPADQLDTFI